MSMGEGERCRNGGSFQPQASLRWWRCLFWAEGSSQFFSLVTCLSWFVQIQINGKPSFLFT
uniref:Uncharacterized protein n=1 Tax=Populus trichocarpa TaxID=3694 RepID=A0A3N7GNH5_POPTR